MALKQYGLYFVLCSKQGNKIEGNLVPRAFGDEVELRVLSWQGVYFRNFFSKQG